MGCCASNITTKRCAFLGLTVPRYLRRQPPPPPTFSPSRSSLGSGYSLQSAAGDEPGATESHNPGGGAGGGGPGQPSGGVAYGPGFAGVSDEDLAAMDPKRAKRLVANRQARFVFCTGQTDDNLTQAGCMFLQSAL